MKTVTKLLIGGSIYDPTITSLNDIEKVIQTKLNTRVGQDQVKFKLEYESPNTFTLNYMRKYYTDDFYSSSDFDDDIIKDSDAEILTGITDINSYCPGLGFLILNNSGVKSHRSGEECATQKRWS